MNFTIEQARKFSGLSQSAMGEQLSISRNTYVALEKGEQYFKVDQMYKFSLAVGIPIKDIKFYEKQIDVQ